MIFETGQQRVPPSEINELGAAVDQEFDPFGQHIELPQQSDARRLQRIAQCPLASRALNRLRRLDQRLAPALDLVVIDIELPRKQLEETLATAGIERQVGAAELGGASTCRDAAGAAIQTAQHLLMKPARVFARKIRTWCPCKNTACGFGDVPPCVAEVC